MDKISDLPDELLIKILSFVPTKAAVSTSILSKRWKFLWMWLSNLEYSDDQGESFLLLRDFINKNLPLHKAPVIERLCLELWEPHDSKVNPEDIKLWVETAISRYVRELEVSCFSDSDDVNMFPSSFFTCESVVVLKLRYLTLKDVPSTGCCLPSLKTLQLESLTYVGRGDSLQNLLSMCHLLEDLEVRFLEDEYPQMFTVIFPVLRKLTLSLPECEWSFDEYEIDTPLLEYLKLEDWNKSSWLFKNTIPNLREAHVHVDSFPFKSGIGSSFTSVKHLNVCSELEEYGCDGFAFDQLEHLELCVCKDDSLDLLAQLLKDSPNLRVLDISILDCHGGDIKTDDLFAWYKGSCVPECMLPSLQVFNWSRYIGRPRDRDMAVYILRNAPNLRTATFKFDTGVPNAEILKMELTRLPPASSTCELVFFE